MTEDDYLRAQLSKARMAGAYAEGVLDAVLKVHGDMLQATIRDAQQQLRDARKGPAYPTAADLEANNG